MTRLEFDILREQLYAKCKDLTKSKGQDYTKGNDDCLINFKEGAAFFGIKPQQTLAIYMKKHMDAIYNYIKTGGQSESEPVAERIKDMINYLTLLHALIVEEQALIAAMEAEGATLLPSKK